jgi:hypothetical protein
MTQEQKTDELEFNLYDENIPPDDKNRDIQVGQFYSLCFLAFFLEAFYSNRCEAFLELSEVAFFDTDYRFFIVNRTGR